ncbi:Aste57867_14446 [Aphanomyces stellatus]|uniref:Aste57867_14446 protein n=1 Tax=Aphanomyces stellatus TaxID=120398 RepID=A0A485L354_9STRA|nr:hypothetical protein As57867_014392 [Aphanomyces stellatus]VFT91268.1 Aste57867_14446 [Aphanomyces stellatus]
MMLLPPPRFPPRELQNLESYTNGEGISDSGDIITAKPHADGGPSRPPRRSPLPRPTHPPSTAPPPQPTDDPETIPPTMDAPATPPPTDPPTKRPTELPTNPPTEAGTAVPSTTPETTTPMRALAPTTPPATTVTWTPPPTNQPPVMDAPSPTLSTSWTTQTPLVAASMPTPAMEAYDLPPPPSPLATPIDLASHVDTHATTTALSSSFPLFGVLAVVGGVIAIVATIVIASYYRRRYREMSLAYLRNMPSNAWTFASTTSVDGPGGAPPPRSPSMSVWTNPNRAASEYGVLAGRKEQRSPAPSEYSTRRARLTDLQTEVNHEAMQHNPWYVEATASSQACEVTALSPIAAGRRHPNHPFFDSQLSYSSVEDDDATSAMSFQTTSTPRSKASAAHQLSMSSWDTDMA